MRSQEQARAACQVERVLHVASRVVRRHVEGLEAVVVVFHLGPVVDLVAHAHEDVFELFTDERERMEPTQGRPPAWQCDVYSLTLELSRPIPGGGLLLSRLEASLQLAFERVQLLPGGALLLGRKAPERLQELRDRPGLPSQEPVTEELQPGRTTSLRERTLELVPKRADALRERWRRISHGPPETCYAVARAALADCTSAPNACGSRAAMSASDLRSRSTPARFRPAMNWL